MTVLTTFTAGTQAKAAEVNDNFTYVQAYTDSQVEWKPIETISFAAATTHTSTGTLTVYKSYKITWDNLSTAGNSDMAVRFNGDSGSNYYYTQISAHVWSDVSSATYLLINTMQTNGSYSGEIILSGKTAAAASGRILAGLNAPAIDNEISVKHGSWVGGNATQLTSITFFNVGGQNMTGQVKIWGRN